MINATRRLHVARCNTGDSKRAAFSEPRALLRKSAINVRESRRDYQVAARRQSIAILLLAPSFSDKCRERQISWRTYRRVYIHRTITTARSSETQLSPTAGMNLPAHETVANTTCSSPNSYFPRRRTIAPVRFRVISRGHRREKIDLIYRRFRWPSQCPYMFRFPRPDCEKRENNEKSIRRRSDARHVFPEYSRDRGARMTETEKRAVH